MNSNKKYAAIPMRFVGPIRMIVDEITDEISVPLATLESPLWSSVCRGARVSRICDGVNTVIIKDCMTRSIVVEADSAAIVAKIERDLSQQEVAMNQVVDGTGRFVILLSANTQIVGNLLFIRFSFKTGDAAGHNMVTKAADALLNWLLAEYADLRYVSISGNYCVDKKVSAVNGILGRGKYVVAEMVIPSEICRQVLRCSPDEIVALNIKKNLIGTNIAGGVRTANAHYANMLLAFYLATGQDAANIVEGSQGITYAQLHGDDLYFSVTLPNIIVGAIGSGKQLDYVQKNLLQLGCLNNMETGAKARRLAGITAATVWCGELSLLAAQINPGELMRAHMKMERNSVLE